MASVHLIPGSVLAVNRPARPARVTYSAGPTECDHGETATGAEVNTFVSSSEADARMPSLDRVTRHKLRDEEM